MTKQLTVLFLVGFCMQLHSQINRNNIIGAVHNDSILVEAIHIYNKNTHKGTISNQFGVFKIPVKENDTLVFDGIQFKKKEIVITKQLLKNKLFNIVLEQNINELQTVEISNHYLSGNLIVDANSVKVPKKMVGNDALNFSNINFNAIDYIDATDRQKPPNPYSGDAGLKFNGGANLLAIIGFIINPLANGLSKIGQHKRKIKQADKVFQLKAASVPNKIRVEFGDAFFTQNLKIDKEQIEAFLIFCKSKNIANLYLSNRKIELIEVLVKESEAFKNEFKIE